jgi:hypothetical protein
MQMTTVNDDRSSNKSSDEHEHVGNTISATKTETDDGHTTLQDAGAGPSSNKGEPPRVEPTTAKRILNIIAEQWFLITLGIIIGFASQIQVPIRHQQLKREVTSYLCISIIFFM